MPASRSHNPDRASPIAPLLARLSDQPSRTWSIIVTLFGDAVVPRGGSLWLGTLLDIFAAIGIGGGVVRTAMSRLAADGWLARTRQGRNSFYALSPHAQAESLAAAPRIYEPVRASWDGTFRMAVLDAKAEDGAALRLREAGFVPLAPPVFVSLAPEAPANDALMLAATARDAPRLARLLWPLAPLASRYEQFLAHYASLALQAGGLDGLHAIVARTLIVHDWRKIALRDPMLPEALLPPDWPGGEALALFRLVYGAVFAASEQWLDANAQGPDGPLPPRAKPAWIKA